VNTMKTRNQRKQEYEQKPEDPSSKPIQTRSQRQNRTTTDAAELLMNLMNTKYGQEETIRDLNKTIEKQKQEIVYWISVADEWEEMCDYYSDLAKELGKTIRNKK